MFTSLAKVPRARRGCPGSPQSARYHTRLQPTSLSRFRFLRSRDGQLTRPFPLAGLAELRGRPKAARARLLRLRSGLGQSQRLAPGGGAEDGGVVRVPNRRNLRRRQGNGAQEAGPRTEAWSRRPRGRAKGWGVVVAPKRRGREASRVAVGNSPELGKVSPWMLGITQTLEA